MRIFTLITSLVVTLCCVVLSGCAGNTDDGLTDLGKPSDGKEDAVGRLCLDAGLPEGCDICAARSWYSDGTCDDFCSNPDPDCDPPVESRCSDDLPSRVGDSTGELNENVTGEVRVTVDDIDALEDFQSRQIWTTCELLDLVESNQDFDVAFEATDTGSFTLIDVVVAGVEYDWVYFRAGDTEVGAIFVANTLDLVGEVSDGYILGCTGQEPPPTGELVCHSDNVTPLGDNSWALLELASSTRDITIDAIESLSEVDSQQIFAASLHLEFLGGDEDFDAVFELPDDGKFKLIDVIAGGTDFDWVKFHRGETEVGVVFAAGTTDIVGVVDDGYITGCLRQ